MTSPTTPIQENSIQIDPESLNKFPNNLYCATFRGRDYVNLTQFIGAALLCTGIFLCGQGLYHNNPYMIVAGVSVMGLAHLCPYSTALCCKPGTSDIKSLLKFKEGVNGIAQNLKKYNEENSVISKNNGELSAPDNVQELDGELTEKDGDSVLKNLDSNIKALEKKYMEVKTVMSNPEGRRSTPQKRQ